MERRNYDELFDALTDEQKEKINFCRTPEELTKTLGELGVELPDELLDAISGGRSVLVPPAVLPSLAPDMFGTWNESPLRREK